MTGRIFIILGIILVIAGILIEKNVRVPIGRLPGDIVVRKGNWTIFVPLMTSLAASAILTIVFYLFRRR